MNNANSERRSESEEELDYSGSTHSLIVDDIRANFFQRESWMTALDLKSSIMIAIDAILISGAESITFYSKQIPIMQFFTIIPPFLSIMMALFCLWPRTWSRPNSISTINDYADKRFDYAASKLARNYAQDDEYLKNIYNDKFEYFQLSIVFAVISLVISFIVILNQIFSA
jgi:hypothetical protein